MHLSKQELLKTWIIKVPINYMTQNIMGGQSTKRSTWGKHFHHNIKVIHNPQLIICKINWILKRITISLRKNLNTNSIIVLCY